jgi:AraC-like DNA-binding protein
MRKYAQSRTFWLVFLITFIAIAGTALAVYMYDWQGDMSKQLANAQQERKRSIDIAAEWMDDVCRDAVVLSDQLNQTAWVQKLCANSNIFDGEFDITRRQNISADYLFHTDPSAAITRRFVIFPYGNICIGKRVWADINSYMGLIGISDEIRGEILLAIMDQRTPASLAIKDLGTALLIVLPVEALAKPRAYLCCLLDTERMAKQAWQMLSEGVVGLRVIHEDTDKTLFQLGQCDIDGGRIQQNLSARYLDWEYQFYVDDSVATIEFSESERYIMAYMLAGVVMCAIIAWLLAMIFYKPVAGIMERAGISRVKGDRVDDYKVIEAFIDQLSESYCISRRHDLLRQLLTGYFEQDERMLRSNGLPFGEAQYYRVMICSEKKEHQIEEDMRAQLQMAVLQMMEQNGMNCELVDTIDSEMILIASCWAEEAAKALPIDALRELVSQHYNVFCGDAAYGFVGVSVSYQSARERQRRARGFSISKCYFPMEWETQWMDALLTRKVNVADGICKELRRENERRLDEGLMSEEDYDRLFRMLIADIGRIAASERIQLESLCEELLSICREGTPDEIWYGITCACAEICKRDDSNYSESTDSARQVVDYIDINYGNHELAMPMLEDVFGLSANTINKCIKQLTGMTFHSYLTKRRIDAACELLAGGGQRISHVADMVGYDTEYSFRRAFQRQTGVKAQDYAVMSRTEGESD